MSIRHGIVSLLAEQEMHGYQLKQEFERRTGGTWPVNIGQVYTTVQRLVRDGLACPAGGHEGDRSDVERFTLTDAGRREAAAWWSTPVRRGAPARDELAIKLALAASAPGVEVRDVVQAQRSESMRALHEYTRLAAQQGFPPGEDAADLAWSLLLDRLIFDAEAEVRWLDHVEARVARAAGTRREVTPTQGVDATPAPGATRGHLR
jgi:DNA-binding PadR family transcriptional regulator